jgi:hypothetical protein
MAVGVKSNYFVPILGDCFARNEAYLGHLRSDLYFRIWFVGASRFPNTNIPTLNSLSVIVEQDMYAPQERAQLHERAISQSIDYRFGRPGFQSIIETLAPSTRYSFVLTAVQGVVTELIVTIRPANTGWFNVYAFKSWASYELLDGSGSSLTGGMPITADYQRTIVDASRQSSGAIDTLIAAAGLGRSSNPIVAEFGDAKTDFAHGTLTGYIPFTGQERLIITTDDTIGAGSYEIRVEYLSVARVNLDRGKVSVYPS